MLYTYTQAQSWIEIWADKVALETSSDPLNHILIATSGNPGCRKRKRHAEPLRVNPKRSCKQSKTMTGQETDVPKTFPEERRRRGRPPTKPQGHDIGSGRAAAAEEAEIANPFACKPPSLASSSLPDSRLPSRPSSPKKRGKDINEIRSDAAIGVKFLESCRPSVKLRSHQEAHQQGPLPKMVAGLYQRLHDTPIGFIPSELKVSVVIDIEQRV